ncbi:MAG: signal peptidase II [Maribacter sp.]|uniref:signal peptidase II n=1 Tax=Maribacter sp. 2307UL18-2 TaxID=3386274 RepID=UPI0039BC74ED
MFKKVFILVLVLLNIGCDQISKNIVRKTVEYQEHISLISDNFILTKVENKGAMMGLGSDLSPTLKMVLLQGLPIVVLLILLFRILQKPKMDSALVFAFACVIGGGIGNLIDRIAHGQVTDFFHIDLGFVRTGIFNMADVSVTMGVLLILILSLSNRKFEM